MSQSTRSFLFGILCGVISLLTIFFCPPIDLEYRLATALSGFIIAFNFVPLPGRKLALVEKIEGASNGVTVFGWLCPIFAIFFLLYQAMP